MNSSILDIIEKENSLDLIQNYVKDKMETKSFKKGDVSSEMFHLFFNVVELGREVRISLKEENNTNSKTKIVDIFLVLISICNSMNINLFEALINQEKNNY